MRHPPCEREAVVDRYPSGFPVISTAKNCIIVTGPVAVLHVQGGGLDHKCLIDAEDVNRVSPRRWYAYLDKGGDWRVRENGGRRYHLPRFLMNAPEGMVVDHVRHNTLDNRKSRLRIVTNQQNILNRRTAARDNRSTGIRGVNATSYDPTRFQARVKAHGKSHYLGVFSSEASAAAAVRAKLAELGVPA